jgi:hypothetical protein
MIRTPGSKIQMLGRYKCVITSRFTALASSINDGLALRLQLLAVSSSNSLAFPDFLFPALQGC